MRSIFVCILLIPILLTFISCRNDITSENNTDSMGKESETEIDETETAKIEIEIESEIPKEQNTQKIQKDTTVIISEPTVISFPNTDFYRFLTSVTSIDTAVNEMVRYNYNYNELGLLLSITHDLTIPYEFPENDYYSVYRNSEYELFYENNELIRIESANNSSECVWNYEDGKLISKHFLRDSSFTTYYHYDEKNNLISIQGFCWSPENGDELDEKYVYSYDNDNRLQREFFEQYGKFKYDISYTYDEYGNMTEKRYHDEIGNYLYSDHYSYNENGYLLSIDYADENVRYNDVVYTYNDHGDLIKEEYFENGKMIETVKHNINYDTNGNIIKYDDVTLVYDEYGYCTKQYSEESKIIYEYTYLTYFIEDADIKLVRDAETLYSEITEDPCCFVDVWDHQS